jgi:hypothetical protein
VVRVALRLPVAVMLPVPVVRMLPVFAVQVAVAVAVAALGAASGPRRLQPLPVVVNHPSHGAA